MGKMFKAPEDRFLEEYYQELINQLPSRFTVCGCNGDIPYITIYKDRNSEKHVYGTFVCNIYYLLEEYNLVIYADKRIEMIYDDEDFQDFIERVKHYGGNK